MIRCPYGFRILGSVREPRRLVNAAAAIAGYAACDAKAAVQREAYLSAFQFSAEIRQFIDGYGNGSTAGYQGPCWSPRLWFDIDREGDLNTALTDTRRLVLFTNERFKLGDDDLLIFYSGSKGFHVGLPTAIWSPEPSDVFHLVCRRMAEAVADAASVATDTGVYDKVRAFRAPNSRHPKTGLHKRHLRLEELNGLSLEEIVELARAPSPFDLPSPPRSDESTKLLAAYWQAAIERVAKEADTKAVRRAATNGAPTLNRSTLEFIRDGADQGDRHRLLFSAAANLGEFGCPPALAVALLEESALDSGLPPKDVRRQIDCGLAAVAVNPHAEISAAPTTDALGPDNSNDSVPIPATSNTPAAATDSTLREKLRVLWTVAAASSVGAASLPQTSAAQQLAPPSQRVPQSDRADSIEKTDVNRPINSTGDAR